MLILGLYLLKLKVNMTFKYLVYSTYEILFWLKNQPNLDCYHREGTLWLMTELQVYCNRSQ
ncbi:hypothetical protein Hanom_Chr09g00813471 [Helianthus anomalus]